MGAHKSLFQSRRSEPETLCTSNAIIYSKNYKVQVLQKEQILIKIKILTTCTSLLYVPQSAKFKLPSIQTVKGIVQKSYTCIPIMERRTDGDKKNNMPPTLICGGIKIIYLRLKNQPVHI